MGQTIQQRQLAVLDACDAANLKYAGVRILGCASLHIDNQIREDWRIYGSARGQGYYRSLADASNLIDDLRDELMGEVAK